MNRIGAFSIAISLSISGAAWAIESAPPSHEPTAVGWYARYWHDSRLVPIGGGRSLNLYCLGSGSPTVILEAGLGGDSFTWWKVQDRIARRTRVCAYDRAGMGRSPMGPFPRDTKAQVADLEALLSSAKIRGPYVLVGHSMGGYNIRVFANRHVRAVVGLVFVDSATENQLALLYPALPAIEQGDKKSIAQVKACANPARSPETADDCSRSAPKEFPAALAEAFASTQSLSTSQTFASELESFVSADSQEVVAENRAFGDIPLIVLTRTELSTNISKSDAELEWTLWNQSHDKLAKLSSAGINRAIPGAGHYVQIDQPNAVVEAVSEVVDAARKRDRRLRQH